MKLILSNAFRAAFGNSSSSRTLDPFCGSSFIGRCRTSSITTRKVLPSLGINFGCRGHSSSTSLTAITPSHRLDGLDKPTVWEEFTPLAVEHNAVNLGQGFPDWEPPSFVIDAMTMSITERRANQYARSAAHMPLAEVLAEEYEIKLNRPFIHAPTEVATTVGCTQAFYCAMQGLINPMDEVILMEPAFDIYSAQVKMAGGVPKFLPLRQQPSKGSTTHLNANEVFRLDMDELKATITPKTKILVINTPHNPTGKMFSKEELQDIADIVEQHPQLTVIADEVYEYIIFDKEHSPHVHFASLPGMYERTLTLSSSGKTFSCTGWKVGWAIGPPSLIRPVASVQQWVTFSSPTPNQDAIALSLVQARNPYKSKDSYYEYLADDYLRKRNVLVDSLTLAGITPIVPAGGFFIIGETSHLSIPDSYALQVTKAMPTDIPPRDWAMARFMTIEVGVCAIPPSAFYSPRTLSLAANTLRFAFCKKEETLFEARERFLKYFG